MAMDDPSAPPPLGRDVGTTPTSSQPLTSPKSRTGLLLSAVVVLVALALGGGYFLGFRRAQPQTSLTSSSASQRRSLPSGLPLYFTPVPSASGAAGKPIAVASSSASWVAYQSPVLHVTLKYPPDWTLVERQDKQGFALYPPGFKPPGPYPRITFDFVAQSYAALSANPEGETSPTPIQVAGVAGRAYEDSGVRIPLEGSNIDLPLPNGTLEITATKGPSLDLRPELTEVLKTVSLTQ